MDPELKEMLDKIKQGIESGKGDSAENKEAVAKVNEELQKMSDKFEAYQKSRTAVSVPGVDPEKFSFAKLAHAQSSRDWSKAGYELEVINATKTAVESQSVGTPADGGVTVPMEVSSQIIDRVKRRTVLMQLGATELPVSAGVGSYSLPTANSGSTAYWVAELNSITQNLLKFGDVRLNPYKVAGLSRISSELLRDSATSIEGFVQEDIAKVLAREIDKVGLVGLGTTQPVGITNTQNILTLTNGDNGDETNWQLISALRLLLEMEETDTNSLGLVSSPAFFEKLRSQVVAPFSGATDGVPVFAPMVSDAALASALGCKIGKTTLMPANKNKGTGHNLTSAIMGDFSNLVFATWGGLEIASSIHGDNFTHDTVQIRATQRVDWGVRNPKAFAVATDVTTSLPVAVQTVTLSSAVADGTSGSATSTKITLTFDKAVTIGASNVTITNGSVGKATKGTVTNADEGANKVWEVAVSAVTEGDVFLSVSGVNGVLFAGVPVAVAVNKQE